MGLQQTRSKIYWQFCYAGTCILCYILNIIALYISYSLQQFFFYFVIGCGNWRATEFRWYLSSFSIRTYWMIYYGKLSARNLPYCVTQRFFVIEYQVGTQNHLKWYRNISYIQYKYKLLSKLGDFSLLNCFMLYNTYFFGYGWH